MGFPAVEAVEYKYLETFFDRTFSFIANTEYIFQKAMQSLYLIRKLDSHDMSKNFLETVYRGLVESILTFNMCTWEIGKEQKQLGCIYKMQVEQKARQIVSDFIPFFMNS